MAQGSSNPTTDIKKVAGTAVDTNTGNASAGTQRVVLASNQPVIPISDNGGSITVDGTFWQTTQPVSGPVTDAQLRASAVPVSLASVPSHAVTNAGTFAVQVDGAALTALQVLDNAVATDGAAAVTGMFQVGGTDGTNAQILSTNTSGHLNIADGGNSITVDGTVASTQSGTWTVQPGNTANTTPWLVKPAESLGTATALGALNAEIVQALNGNLGVGSTITAISTPTGITLTPYVSYDGGTNWTATQFFNVTSALALSTITTFIAGDSYAISAGDGATHVKVRATAWTSGSVTVRLSASNSQGLVNLKSTAVHDDAAGTYTQLVSAVASSTAPTAVSANGDAVRLWATTSGALNIADGGGNISIDDGGNSITVDGTVTANAGTGNFTVTQATAANLNATVTGTVELGATSLAALENISVTVPGTVDLGTVSLTALETITVTSGTPNNFQSKVYGAVTTAAPAYTNATDNALSLTTSGSLRTAVSEALPAGTNNIGDVDVLSVIPGTGATNLGKAVDSASAATDTGVASLAIRTDTLATLTPAVSDYTQLRVNSVGRLWASATIDAALPAGANAIGSITNTSFASTQSGTWTVQPGNTANTTPWLTRGAEFLGTATALGALNAEIVQALSGTSGAAATITAVSAPTGITLIPYASYDGGTNWTATQFFNSANGDAISTLTSFTAADTYSISAGDGATHVKVVATAWTSGSVTIRLSTSNSLGLVNLKSTSVHDQAAGSFIQQIGAVASSTAPTAVSADGDAVRLWATTSGALNIADGGTTLSIDDGGGSITVDGTFWQTTQPVSIAATVAVSGPLTDTQLRATAVPVSGTVSVNALPAGTNNIGDVDVLSIVPGTAATNLGKAVDGVAGATDTGVMALAVRDDALATLTPIDGDYTQLRVTSQGRLWASATIDAALPTGTNTIGAVNIAASQTLATVTTVGAVTAITNALPAGTNAIGKLAANDGIDIGDVTINNASIAVTGPLTDTQLRATAVPVSLASLPTLPAGTNAIGTVTAVGTAASGAAASGNPVVVAGVDGSNLVRPIFVAADGAIKLGASSATIGTVNISAAQTLATVTTVGAVTAITNALPAGNNNIGDVDVASIVPGTAATNLGKAVDSAAGATDVGVAALVLRDDALAAISPADGDYTRLRVNSTGRLWATTDIEGAVANAANSSTTALAGSAVFTGTSVDVSAYAQIRVNVFASHASATNGLSMQLSPDGTNWDHTSTFTVPAANDISYLLPVTHKFFRIVYTNGGTSLSAFRLTTALITNATTGTVKELSSSIDRSDFALSTRSVIAGPATPGTTIALNEVTVKSASTAAATTDTALVTQLAPTVGTLGSVSVKTAITEPAFGTDVALTVQTRDPVRIRPSETYRDPVDKMRVSMGQSLIDTDFEYGIQPTKWESLTLLNNRATAFYDVTQVAPGTIGTTAVTISAITASSKTVTITGTNLNAAGVFAVGQPIFVTGTLDTANADGWWIVDTVAATTLTFLVNNAPAASLYDATKTYIYPGTFFTGSSIALPSNTTIAATVATADTVGNFTCGASTLAVGNPVYVTGTNSGTGSISGYASGNVYYIIATNGTTTFQLSATPGGAGVTTVAGTLVGLTFSMNAITVSGTTVIVRTLNDHGLRVNNGIYMKGTSGVTGGPVNGTWNIATTPLNNVFTYVTNTVATGAIIPQGGVNSTLYPRQPGYIEHRPYDGGVQFSNETAYHGYSDIRQTRRYFRYQSGKGIQFSTGTIMKPPFYVDSLTASGTTVTVTTKYPHGLLTGSTLIVSGASPAAYNGTFTVTGSTPLTITYTAGSAPGTSPATGFPITVSPGTWYGGSNRVGMFDQQNGFFFEFDGQTLYAVIRKSTDQISGKVGVTLGSQVVIGTSTFFSSQLKPGDQVVIRGMAYLVQNIQSDTSMTVYPEYRGVTTSNCVCTKTVEIRTSQSGWNIDTVNSGTRSLTNPNGFQLDLTKMQMFYADYSWYGAGAVRFGFKDQRGEVIFCHRVVNSNVNYEAYMRSGNLPARYETNTLPARTYLTLTLAAATTTGGTITVDSTTLFPPSGTVILTQSTASGAYSEYITYSAKTATTFTILARAQTGGVGTAQTFFTSATAPIKVEMYAPQAAQTLSHWGSSVIMDGGYDDDKSLVFNTGMTTPMITATAGTRYPLMSLRLAPTVDNGITGLLGAREIINRMQLALRSIGTYTTNVAFRIEILLNARVSGGTFAPVGGSSLSQICYHTNTQTVSGGESMFAFYATANDTNSMDLEQVRDLGTSILGGGTTLSFPTGNNEKYPDGPDIVTVIAIPLTSNAASSIVARLNWTEAQA